MQQVEHTHFGICVLEHSTHITGIMVTAFNHPWRFIYLYNSIANQKRITIIIKFTTEMANSQALQLSQQTVKLQTQFLIIHDSDSETNHNYNYLCKSPCLPKVKCYQCL
jgi:hypothetical protein